jgi:hypothetical protein
LGDERLDTIKKDGENKRAQHLYGIATTTKNGDLRREALLFLGALERGGSVEAARALEKIRKNTKSEGDPAVKA